MTTKFSAYATRSTDMEYYIHLEDSQIAEICRRVSSDISPLDYSEKDEWSHRDWTLFWNGIYDYPEIAGGWQNVYEEIGESDEEYYEFADEAKVEA